MLKRIAPWKSLPFVRIHLLRKIAAENHNWWQVLKYNQRISSPLLYFPEPEKLPHCFAPTSWFSFVLLTCLHHKTTASQSYSGPWKSRPPNVGIYPLSDTPLYPHTKPMFLICGCSFTQLCPTLRPHGRQHARLPCPSLSPGVCSNSCPLSRWCHPTISSSATPFPFCLQSFLASGSFSVSQLFASGGQSTRASASDIWSLTL